MKRRQEKILLLYWGIPGDCYSIKVNSKSCAIMDALKRIKRAHRGRFKWETFNAQSQDHSLSLVRLPTIEAGQRIVIIQSGSWPIEPASHPRFLTALQKSLSPGRILSIGDNPRDWFERSLSVSDGISYYFIQGQNYSEIDRTGFYNDPGAEVIVEDLKESDWHDTAKVSLVSTEIGILEAVAAGSLPVFMKHLDRHFRLVSEGDENCRLKRLPALYRTLELSLDEKWRQSKLLALRERVSWIYPNRRRHEVRLSLALSSFFLSRFPSPDRRRGSR